MATDSGMGGIDRDPVATGDVSELEADASFKDEVHVVLVGISGAGKSTLVKNTFGFEIDTKISVNSKTKNLKTYKTTKNDVTINIIDTVGFSTGDKKQQLKELSQYAKEADLVIYCLPVGPGSRFELANPSIMRSLQDAFGKDIWKHCMVALTFSNLAWDGISRDNNGDKKSTIREYKDYITAYVDMFRQQLQTLKVDNVDVKSIFDDPAERRADVHTVMCIPACYQHNDKIFKDEEESINWSRELLGEIMRVCKLESSLALLKYWYGRKCLQDALEEHTTGLSMGAGMAGGVAGGGLWEQRWASWEVPWECL